MDKRFLSVIGVIIVLFVGFLLIHNKKDSTTASSSKPTSHIEGSGDITLVEYGDYECPACESFYTTVNQVADKYSTKIKYQFRNLPLTSIHPNAFAGARAAEAADLQGKFWQMHDQLYDSANWSQWSTSSNPTPYFDQYAKNIGLDVTKFKADFKSAAVNNRINADIAEAKRLGHGDSTPAFFLDGTYIDNSKLIDSNGAPSVDAFSKVIDAALAKQ